MANQPIYLPASAYSKLFWLEALQLPADAQAKYHVYGIFHYAEQPDRRRLEQALQLLVNTHYNLRTTFANQGDALTQVIHPTQTAALAYYSVQSEAEIQALLPHITHQPFDLVQGPLFRFALIDDAARQRTTLVLVFHHIILDGTQFDALLQQLSAYYHHPIADTTTDQADIHILQDYLATEPTRSSKAGIEFWVDRLRHYPLHIDFPPAAHLTVHPPQAVHHLSSLDPDLYQTLKRFSAETHCSLFQILKTVWALLISVYTHQDRLVISFPVNLRSPAFAGLKGAFVNTPFYFFERTGTFLEYLQAEQAATDVRQHWSVNRVDIMAALQGQEADFSLAFAQSNLFIHGPVLKSPPTSQPQHLIGGSGGAKLCCFYQDTQATVQYGLIGSTEWVDAPLLEQLQTHFAVLLARLLAEPNQPLKTASCLSADAFHRIAYQWNPMVAGAAHAHTIPQRFAAQAAQTPEQIALVGDDETLTYQALNQRANQLAHYLQQYALQTDDLVAVCLPRSVDLIIAFLAVLKVGAAYVPLSPVQGREPLQHIIQDTRATVAITHSRYQTFFPPEQALLVLDSPQTKPLLCQQPLSNPNTHLTARALAYVMYTSGTTGQPKGVMVEHRNVVSLAYQPDYLTVRPTDAIAQFADIAFDAATFEIYTALLNGATLCIPADPLPILADPQHFQRYLREHRITILWLTKTLFDQLYLASERIFSSLEYLLVGGEALNTALINALAHSPHRPRHLLNGYGPTECTTFSTVYAITPEAIAGLRHIPIGNPVCGRTAYVLDRHLQLLPQGAIGELYLGGTGLARGYLHQATLTAEKFIPHPWQPGERLYQTGDLARYAADGTLDYLGRADSQIKIRGYRVELSAIERRLCEYPGIQQAVVLLQQHPAAESPCLVGYYVADQAFNPDAMLAELSKVLPPYSLPSVLVHLPRLPLTQNGKLDRQALPLPDWSGANAYVAPRTTLEQQIVDLYAELFALPAHTLGSAANFFRLGGNSLLAIRLAHRLSQCCQVNVASAEIFRAPTIAQLAQTISTLTTPAPRIPRAAPATQYPLSFAQERLWVIEHYERGTAAYSIPSVLKLQPNIALPALLQAFQAIVARHAILRTLFMQNDQGHGYQSVQQAPLPITQRACATLTDYQHALTRDIAQAFDLTRDYPIRICVYAVAEPQEHYVLVNMHHIASDGGSLDLFQHEWVAYYEHYHRQQPLQLPELPIQYADFALWQRTVLPTEPTYQHKLDYWRTRLAQAETLNLATDKPRPTQLSYAGKTLAFAFSPELSAKLRQRAQTQGCTLYTVLLAGFYVLLYQYTGQTDIVVGTPMTQRTEPELQDLIGLLVNMLVQREQLDLQQPIAALMAQLHQHLTEAQRSADVPFEVLVQTLTQGRDPSRHALVQVTFAVQHFGQTHAAFTRYCQPQNTIEPLTSGDLGCLIDDSQATLQGQMLYADSLFEASTLQRFAEHYLHILQQMITTPEQPLTSYQALTPADYQRIVYDWNSGGQAFPLAHTIDQLFEAQVARTPQAIAVVEGEQTLSYHALNAQANQWARLLKRAAVTTETPVGIYLTRSRHTLIGILAILKAGGTCVPLDMAEPAERLSTMIADTQLQLILVDSHSQARLSQLTADVQLLDITRPVTAAKDNLPREHTLQHLALVVYTSGSTGKPKGVMLPHRVFARCAYWATDIFRFTATDRFLFKSIRAPEEYWFPLLIGAPVIVAPPGAERDARLLLQTLSQQRITVANFTPSFLTVLLEQLDSTSALSLKHVFCAGELLATEVQNRFFTHLSAALYNFYGLAEAPYTAYLQSHAPHTRVLIGKPGDAQVYILNAERQPVPIGVVGELYIGGVGLARGYWRQPELTAKRFLANPFNPHSRLYKTGDLVRYWPDGIIEYIGRNDFQIKLRGFRVELSEIEHRLAQYPGIQQVAVVAHQGDHDSLPQYLVGYYVAASPLDEAAMLAELSQHLPDYMVPAVLVYLTHLPLNTIGKLNRKALPRPQWHTVAPYLAPQNPIEHYIVALYAELFTLPVHSISVHAHFFRLGGNSIMAIQVAHLLSRHFGVQLSIAEIFKNPTIAQLATTLASITRPLQVIPVANRLSQYPLSFAQERLWFIAQYEQGTAAYHLPRCVQLKHTVARDALLQALQAIVARHEVLRSIIVQDHAGKAYQVVQTAPLPIALHRCSTHEHYQQLLADDINRPFDLRQDYPIRVCLYERIDRPERYLLINLHHIASDGWSTDLLQQELLAYYAHDQQHQPLTLPALPIQYKDFAVWQRDYLRGAELEQQLAYWRTRLAGYETLQLPTDYPRSAELQYAGAQVTFALPVELSAQLRTLAQTHGYSLYTVLLAGFYLVLHQYSGQTDLIVGTPIANRHHDEITHLIGFFVNMLVQREQLDRQQPLTQLLVQIHQHQSEAQRYQDLPFEHLVQALILERDTRRHPLFQVLFAVQSFGPKASVADYYEGVDITHLHTVTRFDLEFTLDDAAPALQGLVTYATHLFQPATVERLVRSYQHILTHMVQAPDQPLHQYQALSRQDYQQLLVDWNQTDQPYPADQTLQQRFEAQVARTPQHIAVVYQDRRLTYQDLNAQANQLAHYLRTTYAIQGDDLIAVCLERSEALLVVILGVLKASAAYVPLDPNYPNERLRYLLHDAKPKVLLTQERCLARTASLTPLPVLTIDAADTHHHLSQQPVTNPTPITTSRNLAYVMYTSGTTGNPKGVMVEHRSVNNTLTALQAVYALNPGDRSAAFTHVVFDVSVAEFFSPLFAGAELHLFSEEVRKDAGLISEYLQTHAIHYLYLPPVLLSLLPRIAYPHLRGILYAGEPCDAATGRYWSRHCPLFNYYGPTETTIYALGKRVVNGDVQLIGKPLANTQAYVLNADLQPVPIGAIGELYIGGVGLARGYWNRPQLTAERFIAHPWQAGARLYQTGDLVRYWPDGTIEYVGRNDFQVKIRGFRVELGEIEQHLAQCPGVRQAVVVAHTAQHATQPAAVVGYYVADHPLDHDALRTRLEHSLPDYMVPAAFVHLQQLPLTINGKLDRQALPPPQWSSTEHYVAPRNPIEQQICELYAELFALPVEQIGSRANFFRLGGNSILAMQVAHRLSQCCNVHLPVAELFRSKTIAQLADAIANITTQNIVIPVAHGVTHYPLSFAQERLWFIEQYEQGTAAYHMPRLTKLSPDVAVDALIQALQAIVARHEVLRTVFVQDEHGREFQSVQNAALAIQRRVCPTLTDYQRLLKSDVNSPFDLRSEYPIRVCLYKMTATPERYLLVNMHHIASDGWSIDIFQKELVAHYEHFALARPLTVPVLPIQYKDFALWQRSYLVGPVFDKQLAYWRTRLAGYQPLRLATNKPRPAQLSYAGKTFFFYLTPELSSQLRTFAQQHDYSLYVVMSAGFYVLLHQITAQQDLLLGTPAANRHYDSIKDLMGSFVNVIAQREQLALDANILQLMATIHQHLIDAQQHQDIPFEKLLQALNIPRDIRFHPLFQVMFSVQSFGIKEEKYGHYFESVDITDLHPITRFDLACFVSTAKAEFKGLFSYSTDLFDDASMQQLLQYYLHILTQMVTAPTQPLQAYQALPSWVPLPCAYPDDSAPVLTSPLKPDTASRSSLYFVALHHLASSLTVSQLRRPRVRAPRLISIEKRYESTYTAPRTPFAKQVCNLFAEILGLPSSAISVDADFFELGGNSILAMQLSFRLSKIGNRSFSIIEVFLARTPGQLAKALQQASQLDTVEDFIVPLRPSGTDSPLFYIPGSQGEAMISFMPVVAYLTVNRPVYGIRSKALDPKFTLPKTLRQQAEATFRSMRKVQPKGPYYIFALCLGGSLAVQIQKLAEEQGEPHGMVFLLDSHPLFNQSFASSPVQTLVKLPPYYERFQQLWARVQGTPLQKLKHLISRVISRLYFDVYLKIPARTEKYYQLLYSGDPVQLQSDLHLLVSADEQTPELLLQRWQAVFQQKSFLHQIGGTHGRYDKSKKIAAIVDTALSCRHI